TGSRARRTPRTSGASASVSPIPSRPCTAAARATFSTQRWRPCPPSPRTARCGPPARAASRSSGAPTSASRRCSRRSPAPPASLRTQAAIEKAELAVVLVDASVPLTEQDTRVISQVVDAGRALVIAYNKWDLMDDDRRPYLEREIEKDLVQVQWAPRVNVSAR